MNRGDTRAEQSGLQIYKARIMACWRVGIRRQRSKAREFRSDACSLDLLSRSNAAGVVSVLSQRLCVLGRSPASMRVPHCGWVRLVRWAPDSSSAEHLRRLFHCHLSCVYCPNPRIHRWRLA